MPTEGSFAVNRTVVNGFLIERGQAPTLTSRLLDRLLRDSSVRSIVMSGISSDLLQALAAEGRVVCIHKIQPAWFADLAWMRPRGLAYLDRRTPNTSPSYTSLHRVIDGLTCGRGIAVRNFIAQADRICWA